MCTKISKFMQCNAIDLNKTTAQSCLSHSQERTSENRYWACLGTVTTTHTMQPASTGSSSKRFGTSWHCQPQLTLCKHGDPPLLVLVRRDSGLSGIASPNSHCASMETRLYWFLSEEIRDFLAAFALCELPPLDQLYFLSARARSND